MACGCPVLASNVGAIPEMLSCESPQNACGICYEPKSVDSLLNALNEYLGRNEREFFSKNALRKVHNEYTIESVFSRLSKIWNN
jgi:glycosyltransferase involved in cell wall biosynthesis